MIILHSAISDFIGYGIASLNIALRLDCAYYPINKQQPIQLHDPKQIQIIQKKLNNFSKITYTEHILKQWHEHDLLETVKTTGKYFVYPIFEIDRFDHTKKLHVGIADEVLVASKWAQEIVVRETGKTTHVVPLGVDRDIFYPQDKSESDTYKFFTIGKAEIRKGHDILAKCFSRAFEQEDDVELHLLINNPFLQPPQWQHWINIFKSTKLSNKINFHPPQSTQYDIAKFINEKDCGLFFSRGEGWNFGAIESLSCGKPIVITNVTAHQEYCTENNSFLIHTNNTEPAHDPIMPGFFDGTKGNWASLQCEQEEQIIEYMRFCYKNRPSNPQGVETAKRFTWDRTVSEIERIIYADAKP